MQWRGSSPETNPEEGRVEVEGVSRLVPVPEGPGPLSADRAGWLAEQLESGHILFFGRSPIALPEADRLFLLSQGQARSSHHKNVAYRPETGRLSGHRAMEAAERERLQSILGDYSERVAQVLGELLPGYASAWQRDFTSFRPVEERGRPSRLRARNDLLHVDAFPTRPTCGGRILRFFTNLNPREPRVWITSETFERLAHRFARAAGFPRRKGFHLVLEQIARTLGLAPPGGSDYDRFMLRFHNFLKENREFQETCPKQRWEFPPGSSWVVFTDMVSHAVLSGQFALEQTFIVPTTALVVPQKGPISILETLCGYRLEKNGDRLRNPQNG